MKTQNKLSVHIFKNKCQSVIFKEYSKYPRIIKVSLTKYE